MSQVRVRSSLSLASASRILDCALALRSRVGAQPIAIAILDAGGLLVAFAREDGCSTQRFEIAVAKAAGALGLGLSSRSLADKLSSRPAFQNAMSSIVHGRTAPVPGGILLVDADGFAIGAVGVTGDTGDMDEFFAIAAVEEAAPLSEVARTEPAAPATDPRSRL